MPGGWQTGGGGVEPAGGARDRPPAPQAVGRSADGDGSPGRLDWRRGMGASRPERRPGQKRERGREEDETDREEKRRGGPRHMVRIGSRSRARRPSNEG